jgi:hypothetical protein
MKVISILIDCVFVLSIWGLNGWEYAIALAIYMGRDLFSIIQGIKK